MWRGHAMSFRLVLYLFRVFTIFVCRIIGVSFQSTILNRSSTCMLSRAFNWVRAHGHCRLEFGAWQEHRFFFQSWDENFFRRVFSAILGYLSNNTTQEVSILRQIEIAFGSNVHIVLLHGSPLAFIEAYVSYLGSRFQHKLMEKPFLGLRLLKHCLQRNAASDFESLDRYSMTQFILRRLKGAENRN